MKELNHFEVQLLKEVKEIIITYDSSERGESLNRHDMGRFIKETIYSDGWCTERVTSELLNKHLDRIFAEFDVLNRGEIREKDLFRFMQFVTGI